MFPDRKIVDLQAPRIVPKRADLVIAFRGVPTEVTYSLGHKENKVGFDPELVVTVVTFARPFKERGEFYGYGWAFVDSISGW